MTMPDELVGKFRFWGVGRSKAVFVAELNGEASLYKALKPHLMSQDIGFSYDLDQNQGTIFVGGIRNVGSFAKVSKSGNESAK